MNSPSMRLPAVGPLHALKPRAWNLRAAFERMCRSFVVSAALSLVLSQSSALAESSLKKPTIVVVRPEAWSQAVVDWKGYRSERYSIVELASESDPLSLRNRIIAEATRLQLLGNQVSAVMLCGAVYARNTPALTTFSEESNSEREVSLPTITPTFIHNTSIRFSDLHTETLSTDSPFGDLDGDGCPDISVGRIPAQSATELKRMLHRSVAYETSQDISDWRDTVHVTAGVGGFGAIADNAIEAVARRYLSDGLPDRFRLQMTYASTNSPYCPDPRRIRETFLGKLNQGGLFWVYIGHGWIDSLDNFKYGNEQELLCRPEDTELFDAPVGPPIAVLLACFTGAIDAKVDCFAERLLAQPRGPVAVVAGTRVTMPYGMSEFASEMLHSCFDQGTTTLGGVILEAKRNMWLSSSGTSEQLQTGPSAISTGTSAVETTPNRTSQFRSAVLAMARTLSPEAHNLDEEKREHTRLMNLLGDPVLEIRRPQEISLNSEESAVAGDNLAVQGTTPWDGEVRLELWQHRDRTPSGVVSNFGRNSQDAIYQAMDANYEKANDLKISELVTSSQNGQFKAMLSTDPTQRGRYVVRARMQSEHDWAIGTKRVTLQRPKKDKPNAADSN